MHTSAAVLASPAPLYYERLLPDDARGDPLVLVHGGAHTGACYRCTPDGRPGWAADFAAQGFEVLIPDWPGCGRSGYVPRDQLRGDLVVGGLRALVEQLARPVTVLVHSMSGPYGFKLLETARRFVQRLVAIAPGPPGNVQPLPEIIAETDDAVEVQALALQWRIPKAHDFLMDERMVRVKLVGNGGRFPMDALDGYRASLVPLPARLLYERQNVQGSQLRLADDADLRRSSVLLVTGTHDTDHPREIDQRIARWLAERGAGVDVVWLADRGITGNGHMMMLEDNSAEIAGMIGGWIRTAGG